MNHFPNLKRIHVIGVPFSGLANQMTANVYVIGADPVTLIDTGPKFPGNLECFREQLRAAGFAIGDLKRIILTHGHADHFGLAASILKAAGGHRIECFIHAKDRWRIARESFHEESWSQRLNTLAAMVGMPDPVLKKVKRNFAFFKTISDSVDEGSTMEDADEFSGDGYCLKVLHTPWHTSGLCCLYETQMKLLFSSDHVSTYIAPTPSLIEAACHPFLGTGYRSLQAYQNSLDKVADLDVSFVLPGHGDCFTDLPSMVSSYLLHHRERMDLVWQALKRKPRPLFHLISDVLPQAPEREIYFALSDLVAYLEMLIGERRVELVEGGPPALYRALA